MSFIRDRQDVSSWLIHFTRDRDPDTQPLVGEDEDRLLHTMEDASALSVLKNIIDEGALVPSYSMRGDKTTIYGGEPATCFTEAPLDAFVRYARERNDPSRCTVYGICLLRREAFEAGARPAIYSLSTDQPPTLIEDEPLCRIIDPSLLPMNEQYRYVAYNPLRVPPIDWTHEREWRWIADRKNHRHEAWLRQGTSSGPLPALPLFTSKANGGYFSRIGFIVATESEAAEIKQALVRYRDAGGNNFDTTFARGVIDNSFVIPVDKMSVTRDAGWSGRIEDLELSPWFVGERRVPSDAVKIRVRRAVAAARAASQEAAREYLESGLSRSFAGGAWVTTEDSISEVTAALLDLDLAKPMAGLYYIVNAKGDLPLEQSQDYHEAAAEAAADVLTERLGQHFGVRTWDD